MKTHTHTSRVPAPSRPQVTRVIAPAVAQGAALMARTATQYNPGRFPTIRDAYAYFHSFMRYDLARCGM